MDVIFEFLWYQNFHCPILVPFIQNVVGGLIHVLSVLKLIINLLEALLVNTLLVLLGRVSSFYIF